MTENRAGYVDFTSLPALGGFFISGLLHSSMLRGDKGLFTASSFAPICRKQGDTIVPRTASLVRDSDGLPSLRGLNALSSAKKVFVC